MEFDDLPNGNISVHSCLTVLQATPALPLQPIAAGRYTDVFEKASGKWRFRTKHIDVRLVRNMSQHLNIVAHAIHEAEDIEIRDAKHMPDRDEGFALRDAWDRYREANMERKGRNAKTIEG